MGIKVSNAPLGRAGYLLGSLAVFFAQHLAAWGLAAALHLHLIVGRRFWVAPLQQFMALDTAGPGTLAAVTLIFLAQAGIVWLAFQRARDSGRSYWLAAWSIAPLVQIPIFLVLLAAAPRSPRPEDDFTPAVAHRARSATTAAVVSSGLIVFFVVLDTLVFRTYGIALFLGTPFLVGALAAWLANRDGDIGLRHTYTVVAGALVLSGVSLVGVALEGVVCVVMALPLAMLAGLAAGFVGRLLALIGRRAPADAALGLLVLPLLMAVDHARPPSARFEAVDSVVVAADTARTWDAIVRMGSIPEKPSPPFRLGLAYPVRGEIRGEGVGAIRYGYFSTGVATERVTEWTPGRTLAFDILTDAPALKELGPYETVSAPHLDGYFRTTRAVFTLTPLSDHRTRMTLTTAHALDIGPTVYWTPWAKWVVHANKARVLTHMKRLAEAGSD